MNRINTYITNHYLCGKSYIFCYNTLIDILKKLNIYFENNAVSYTFVDNLQNHDLDNNIQHNKD